MVEPRYKQSMQVSMATLKAATTGHCHTDRVSEDTYHSIIISAVASERESGDGEKALNRHKWHSEKANCRFSHSWQAKHISPAKLCMGSH